MTLQADLLQVETESTTLYAPQCGQCNHFDSRGTWGYCSKRTVTEFWNTGAMTLNEIRQANAVTCNLYQESIPF